MSRAAALRDVMAPSHRRPRMRALPMSALALWIRESRPIDCIAAGNQSQRRLLHPGSADPACRATTAWPDACSSTAGDKLATSGMHGPGGPKPAPSLPPGAPAGSPSLAWAPQLLQPSTSRLHWRRPGRQGRAAASPPVRPTLVRAPARHLLPAATWPHCTPSCCSGRRKGLE